MFEDNDNDSNIDHAPDTLSVKVPVIYPIFRQQYALVNISDTYTYI